MKENIKHVQSEEPLPYDPGIGGDSTDYKKKYNRARFIAQYFINVDVFTIHEAKMMFPEFDFERTTLDEFIETTSDALFES